MEETKKEQEQNEKQAQEQEKEVKYKEYDKWAEKSLAPCDYPEFEFAINGRNI